ncbi:MAG TPA: carboxypeptidase regulatory-like domain-containing protein [Acidobacteriota bacterium]
MGKKLFWAIGLAVACLVAAAPSALAQSEATTGRIQGTVLDESGAVLPGVQVDLVKPNTGYTRTLFTDETGKYFAALLPLGDYVVTFKLEGFATTTREGVYLSIGQSLNIDATLKLASVAEAVTVTAEAPLVEVNTTNVSATISTKEIENLPIDGRDFVDFALLTGQANISPGREGISVGGSRSTSGTTTAIDGADASNTFFGGQLGGTRPPFTISQESVREFQVITGGYNAEFGRSAGGLINVVTKSGTNELHGGFHYFVRNNDLASDENRSAIGQENLPIGEFHQYQYGGSFGGPIVRDKAHFFGSIDIQDRSDVQRTEVDPNSPMSAAGRAFFESMGLVGPLDRTDDNLVFFVKVDTQLTQDQSLTARFNYSDSEQVNGTNTGGVLNRGTDNNGLELAETATFVGQHTWLLSDKTFNEFRYNYTFEDRPREIAPNPSYEAEIQLSTDRFTFGKVSFLPIPFDLKRHQITDNFSYLFGNHDLKIGVDANLTDASQTFRGYYTGRFRYNTYEDFVAGNYFEFIQFIGLNGLSTEEASTITIPQNEYAFYVQDTWKPKSNLTLNYGLRWEGLYQEDGRTSPLRDDIGVLNDDTNNWAPRFGAAWDPNNDGKSVVRFGTGIFYSRIPSLLLAQPLLNNGVSGARVSFRSPNDVGAPQCSLASCNVLPDPLPDPPPPGVVIPTVFDIATLDPDVRIPRTWQANIGYEREIAPDIAVSVDYNYARTENLQRIRNLNLMAPVEGAGPGGRPLFNRSVRVDPNFGLILQSTMDAESRYHAVVFALNKKYSNGYQFQMNYTWSRDKDNDSNERNASGINTENQFDLDNEYALSDKDRTHKFVFSGIYEPFWGIQLSTIVVVLSGGPYTACTNNDANGDGNRFCSGAVALDRPWSGGQPVFGRNSERQDRFFNWDIRIAKSFDLGPAGSVEGLFEVFNLTNEANPFTTNTIYENTPGGTPLTSFGVNNRVTTEVRRMQLGVRYVF